jgi:hypothetical protein
VVVRVVVGDVELPDLEEVEHMDQQGNRVVENPEVELAVDNILVVVEDVPVEVEE